MSVLHMAPHSSLCWAALAASFLAAISADSSCSCPDVSGFYFYPTLDHVNDDILCAPTGNLNAYDLGSSCASNVFCSSFTLYQGPSDRSQMSCAKYLTSPMVIGSKSNMGLCQGIYVKMNQSTGCPSYPGFSVFSNMDNPDGDIIQVPSDINKIGVACSQDCRCKSFNSKGVTKTASVATVSAPGICFYAKSPNAPACSPPSSPSPPPSTSLDFVRDVSIGSAHTCALISSGKVKCWGQNIYGQLGLGMNQAVIGFVTVDLGQGAYVTAIAAGSYHTCALLSINQVKCWGLNTNGQLGLGSSSSTVGTSPGEMGNNLPTVDLGQSSYAVGISSGGMHTCALLQGGGMKCWGLNTFGQLGLGDSLLRGKDSTTMGDALKKVDLGSGLLAVGISTGWFHTCARLLNSQVKCWGFNMFGQLGRADGSTQTRGTSSADMGNALPAIVLGGPASSLASNGHHTCAAVSLQTRDPLSVKCWGDNKYSELGQGDTYSYGLASGSMGSSLKPVNLGSGRSAMQVAPGNSYTCAIINDGSLKCWGYNGYGNLGLEKSDNSVGGNNGMGDVLPAVNLGNGYKTESVATGFGSTTCAVLDRGMAVKCWGKNDQGQSGQPGSRDTGSSPVDMGDNLRPLNLNMPASIKAASGGTLGAIEKPTGDCEVCASIAVRPPTSDGRGGLFGAFRGSSLQPPSFDDGTAITLATFFTSDSCGSPSVAGLSPFYTSSPPSGIDTSVSVCASGSRAQADAWMQVVDSSCANSAATLLATCGAFVSLTSSCGGTEMYTSSC